MFRWKIIHGAFIYFIWIFVASGGKWRCRGAWGFGVLRECPGLCWRMSYHPWELVGWFSAPSVSRCRRENVYSHIGWGLHVGFWSSLFLVRLPWCRRHSYCSRSLEGRRVNKRLYSLTGKGRCMWGAPDRRWGG